MVLSCRLRMSRRPPCRSRRSSGLRSGCSNVPSIRQRRVAPNRRTGSRPALETRVDQQETRVDNDGAAADVVRTAIHPRTEDAPCMNVARRDSHASTADALAHGCHSAAAKGSQAS